MAVATTKGQRRARRTEAAPGFGSLLWRSTTSDAAETIALSEVATVRRGVATGANNFFFLRDVDLEGLPAGAVVPALRRLRHVEGDVLNKREHDRIGRAGQQRWLLWLSDPKVVSDAAVQALIAKGQVDGVDKTVLATSRALWYLVEHVKPPDIFVALMSRGRIRAVENRLRVVGSNSMYGLYVENKRLVAPLSSWLKVEPRELLTIRIPKAERLLD
jgi:hypothetical protein